MSKRSVLSFFHDSIVGFDHSSGFHRRNDGLLMWHFTSQKLRDIDKSQMVKVGKLLTRSGNSEILEGSTRCHSKSLALRNLSKYENIPIQS
jgi:hypothetical protein